ncbi:hypothetical protein [Vineibacter terrae]|nr:hypothetical protein [Vineibacter terrae]
MSQAMPFALIGYGAWGRFHARSIAKAHNADLAAIVAQGDANATAAAQD